MEDYPQCLTRIKQKIRRASEKLTRQRIILQHTECRNRNAKSGQSKCGPRRWDFMKAFDSISHNSIWEASPFLQSRPWIRLPLEENLQRSEGSVLTDEESVIFDIPKGSKEGDPMSSLLFNTVLQYAEIQRWQKKKRNGNLLERPRSRLPYELAIC